MASEISGGLPPAARRGARIAIPVLVVGTLVALRPEIVTGTFSSVTSVLKVVALVAVWMGFSYLVRRFVANAVARTAVIGAAGAAVVFFTVLPYFRDETVDDPFPVAVTADMPTSIPVAAIPTPTSAALAAVPGPEAVVTRPPSTTVPAGPVKLGSGPLRGLAGHRGSGEAALYRQADGSLLVRFEDFDVSSVPSPVVYLVPGTNQQRPGGVKLGTLRGNNGNLNMNVPAGTEVSGPQTILIWCEAFSVPVAGATAT